MEKGFRVWTRPSPDGLERVGVPDRLWRLATAEEFPSVLSAYAWSAGIEGEVLIAVSDVVPDGAAVESGRSVAAASARE